MGPYASMGPWFHTVSSSTHFFVFSSSSTTHCSTIQFLVLVLPYIEICSAEVMLNYTTWFQG